MWFKNILKSYMGWIKANSHEDRHKKLPNIEDKEEKNLNSFQEEKDRRIIKDACEAAVWISPVDGISEHEIVP